MTTTILITPEGEWVLADTPEFYAALGNVIDHDCDAIRFAVINLGFIKLQIHPSIIEIELHPRNVELAAILAVQQQLLGADVKLFHIKYFDTTWHNEIATIEATIARLLQLVGQFHR